MFERKGLTTAQDIEKMKAELATADTLKGKAVNANKKIWKACSSILFVAVVGILLVVLLDINKIKNDGGIPNLFGYYIFTVETGSMEPTLEVGDMFIAKEPSNPESIEEGTIVTFYNTRNQVVTHRIIEVTSQDGEVAYVTKGDNTINSIDPDLLTPDRVIAVYRRKLSLRD